MLRCAHPSIREDESRSRKTLQVSGRVEMEQRLARLVDQSSVAAITVA